MLSDADLEEIRQGLRDGLRGPILLKWCQQLLAERDELAARLQAAEATRDSQAQPKQPLTHEGPAPREQPAPQAGFRDDRPDSSGGICRLGRGGSCIVRGARSCLGVLAGNGRRLLLETIEPLLICAVMGCSAVSFTAPG
jgi:hypothetical protein